MPMSAPANSNGQQQTFGTDITEEESTEAVLRRVADAHDDGILSATTTFGQMVAAAWPHPRSN